MPNLNIVGQANAVKEALEKFATSEGGKAFIASDLLHMWNIAYQNTQGLRVIVCFGGFDMRGGMDYGSILLRADFHWKVAICRGRGFNAERGASLTDTSVNAKPLYQLLDDAMTIIRSMIGASVEAPVDFRSIRPMPMNEGSLVDGYLLEFDLVADIPSIKATPDEVTITEIGSDGTATGNTVGL